MSYEKIRINSAVLVTIALISFFLSGCGSSSSIFWTPKTYIAKSFIMERSAFNGKKYQIYVVLPEDYGKSNDPYPVLYTLDGEELHWRFGKILEEKKKRVILVGISNMGDPNRSEDNGMPGILDFSKFITEELAPIIEDSYNIDPKRRAILGQSWTGVGVSYLAFLESPEKRYFQTYISIDGAYISDVYSSIESLASTLQQKTDTFPVTIILHSAEKGMYQEGKIFYDQISKYKFNDYHVSFSIVPGVYHAWSIIQPVFLDYIECYENVDE